MACEISETATSGSTEVISDLAVQNIFTLLCSQRKGHITYGRQQLPAW